MARIGARVSPIRQVLVVCEACRLLGSVSLETPNPFTPGSISPSPTLIPSL